MIALCLQHWRIGLHWFTHAYFQLDIYTSMQQYVVHLNCTRTTFVAQSYWFTLAYFHYIIYIIYSNDDDDDPNDDDDDFAHHEQ